MKSMSRTFLCVMLLATFGCVEPAPTDEPAPVPPKAAVSGSWSGDTFFTSIQLASGGDAADFETQVKTGLDQLGKVLQEAGLSYSNVVKNNVFLTSADNFQPMNGIYKTYFQENPPARTTVFVNGLPGGAGFGITSIAVRNTTPEFFYPEGVEPSPTALFSPAILAGEVLYLSGQGSRNYLTRELPEGIDANVRQCMENMGAILKAAGMDFSNVVKANVYLTDMADYAQMNEVYTSYFKGSPPARTTVSVSGLPGEVPVEITFVAVKDASRLQVVRPESMEARPMFSTALLYGNRLYISGKAGTVEGGTAAQTREIMDAMGTILQEGGMDFSHVVEGRAYLKNMADLEAMQREYGSYFENQVPALTSVGVLALPPAPAVVEIALVAEKP